MSFLTPLAIIAGLLAIPIILLYMLRLRRREVTVSSNMLWQQILQDKEANTPWQRLRRNLLLFLQLLILAALVLALMRPFVIVPVVSAGQIALILDASASMNATETNGVTRFELAQQTALDIIDTMSPGDQMTIIRAAGAPEIVAPYTSDVTVLRAAVENAQPGAASADWNTALTLAAAGAAGSEDFNVVIVSDGGGALRGENRTITFPAIPGDLRYVPVGAAQNNLAITALATRSLPGEAPQLFAEITNYGVQDTDVIFDLRVDGELFTAQTYTVPAGESIPLTSAALPPDFGALQAGLTLPASATYVDHLALDNTAYTVEGAASTRRALIMSEEGNLFVEQVFRSLPGVTAVQGDIASGLPNEPYDLYVFDGWLPSQLPEGDLLIIDPPRSTELFAVGAESNQTTNIRVQRDDPRMTFVDFGAVNVLAFRQVTASWAEPLITSDGGALLLAGEAADRQVAILTFDLRDSDLPLQIDFPILMASLIDWFTPPRILDQTGGVRVGGSLSLTPPTNADTVRVTLPGGITREYANTGALIFAETDQLGLYTVEALDGGDVIAREFFAVNLFDAGESAIAPNPAIQLGGAPLPEAEEDEIGQREYWTYLLIAALLILMIEWYAYHRRLRAPTLLRPMRAARRGI